MASGYFESATGTNLEIGAEWTSVPNASTNSSEVRVKVYITHYDIYCAALTGSYVSAGSRTSYFARGIDSPDTSHQKTYIADETFTVEHSADGTKSVQIAAGWVFNGTYNGHYIGTLEVSGQATLDRIERASDFSCPAVLTLAAAAAFTVRPASISYRHRVKFSVGGATSQSEITTEQTFDAAPDATLAAGMTSSDTASGTVTVETYRGNVKIGEKSKIVSYAVPATEDFLPDFTLTFIPTSSSALVTSEGIVCADITEGALAVTNAAAKYSASVSSVEIACGTKSAPGQTLSLGKLTAGECSYSATVTDSRGHSTTKRGSVTVLPYGAPRAENVSVTRCKANGDADDEGAYISAYADSVCSDLGGVNTSSMTLTVKTRAGSAVGTWSLTSGETKVVGGSFSHTASYVAEITVTDSAGQSTKKSVVVPTSFVDFHLKRGAARFGGYCERPGFECDYPARFSSGVSVGGDPVADFATEITTSGIWTAVKYASGRAECFGAASETLTPAASGALFSADVAPRSYPAGLFLSAPYVVVSSSKGLATESGDGTPSSSPTVKVYFTSGSSSTCEISYLARGTWRSAT